MPSESIRLSFCEIHKTNDDVIEVVTDYGVEVGGAEIREYHSFFDTLAHPVGVLVNRANDYSYSFDAQSKIATHKNMAAAAILVLDPSMERGVEFDVSVIQYNFPVKIFTNRCEALDWLTINK